MLVVDRPLDNRPNSFKMGRLFRTVFVCLALGVCVGAMTVAPDPQGQDGPTTAVPQIQPEEALDRPIDRSMEPIYTMTNWFLEVALNPNSIVDLANKTDLHNFGDILNSLSSDWQTWASHYYSYIICAVFTVIYTLGLPIAGMVVCCCRSQGKCGGNTSPFDRKYTKYKRLACAITLGFFMKFLLLGVTSSFIANQLIHEQTNDNITKTITSSLGSINNHKSLTLQQLDRVLTLDFPADSAAVADTIENLPSEVQKDVGAATNVGPLLESAKTYIDRSNETLGVLGLIDNVVDDLHAKTTDLKNKIIDEVNSIQTDFTSCENTISYCKQLLDIASSPWETVASYDSLRNKTFPHINVMMAVYSGGIYNKLASAGEEFNKVSEAVEAVARSDMDKLKNTTVALNSIVNAFQQTASSQLGNFSIDVMADEFNSSINPWVKDIGNYRYYGGIAVSSVALLIVVLLSFGLLVGACGERAGEDAECCNRGQAACLLMSASGCIFGLSWILAICSLILLVVGGVAHNDLCDHLVTRHNPRALNLLSGMLSDNFNITAFNDDLSVFDVYLRCEDDPGIYTAAQIDQIRPDLNVTRALDLSQYGIDSSLAGMKTATYNIAQLVIAKPTLTNSLQALETEIKSIDFTNLEAEMFKSVTSVEISEVQDLVDRAAADDSITDADFKSKIALYPNKIRNLETNFHQKIIRMKDLIMNYIDFVRTTEDSFDAVDFEKDLKTGEAEIDGVQLQSSAVNVADDIDASFRSLALDYDYRVRTMVGRCGVVYESVTDVIDSVCIQFLYPFNAYWYSIGWCLLFFIPTLWVMLALVGLYRKTDKYDELEEEETAGNHGDGAQVATSSVDNVAAAQDFYPMDEGTGSISSPQRPLPRVPETRNGRENRGYAEDYPRGGRIDAYREDPGSYQDRMYDGADYNTEQFYRGGGGNIDAYNNRQGYSNGGYRY